MTTEARVGEIHNSIPLEKCVKELDPEYLRDPTWRVLQLIYSGRGSHLVGQRDISILKLLEAEQTLARSTLAQPLSHSSKEVADAILLDRMQQCSPSMKGILASVWFARQFTQRGILAPNISEEVFQNPQLLTS